MLLIYSSLSLSLSQKKKKKTQCGNMLFIISPKASSSFVSVRTERRVHHSMILYTRTGYGHCFLFGDRYYKSLVDLINEESCLFRYPLFTRRYERLFALSPPSTPLAVSNSAMAAAATSSANSNYEVPSQMYIYGVPVAAIADIIDGSIKL